MSAQMSLMTDLLFSENYLFLFLIFSACLIPSMAACESVFMLIFLFDGVAKSADHIAASSARVDDGQCSIFSKCCILCSSNVVHPYPILVSLSCLSFVSEPSVYIVM